MYAPLITNDADGNGYRALADGVVTEGRWSGNLLFCNTSRGIQGAKLVLRSSLRLRHNGNVIVAVLDMLERDFFYNKEEIQPKFDRTRDHLNDFRFHTSFWARIASTATFI